MSGRSVEMPVATIPVTAGGRTPAATLFLRMVGRRRIIGVGVAITAVSVVPWRELSQAGAPLAEVMARAAPWFPGWAFIVLTIFAVRLIGEKCSVSPTRRRPVSIRPARMRRSSGL